MDFGKFMISYIDDRKRKLVGSKNGSFKIWSHETCDRLGYIVLSNILKQVMVVFSYRFHSLCLMPRTTKKLNQTIREDISTQKSKLRKWKSTFVWSWLRSSLCGRFVALYLAAPWLGLCQSKRLMACPFSTLFCVETHNVVLLLN